MLPNEYQKLAERTENKDYKAVVIRSTDDTIVRLDHAGMGMVTEVGEFMDVLKRFKIYGKKIDFINLGEEVGDLMWYIALTCNALNINLEDVMIKNINKLKTRYPDKYTNEKAINRNLETERQTLQ